MLGKVLPTALGTGACKPIIRGAIPLVSKTFARNAHPDQKKRVRRRQV